MLVCLPDAASWEIAPSGIEPRSSGAAATKSRRGRRGLSAAERSPAA
jgi:hypothetical protein